MTNQTDLKKLAEQMASSMNIQKHLMQSFIDTTLEKMEENLGYTSVEPLNKTII